MAASSLSEKFHVSWKVAQQARVRLMTEHFCLIEAPMSWMERETK